MKKWWPLLLFLLGLDFLTKIYALHFIPPLELGGIPIFSLGGITFSLSFITNTGAAWGVLSGYAGWLFALRTLIIFSLIFFVPKKLPLWLVITGAVGNAIDYCLYGHVIDFFHFTFWGYTFPIFNIADSCITLGVLALLLSPRKAKQTQLL